LLKAINAFWRLDSQQKGLLFNAWLCFAKWDLAIRFVPYRFWRKTVFLPKHPSPQPQQPTNIYDVIQLIEKAGRHHWGHMNCLRRCLVAQELLSKRGVTTEFMIGVRKSADTGKLEAHSWLCFDGAPINDDSATIDTYTILSDSKDSNILLKSLTN
jgi:hypothetical protein